MDTPLEPVIIVEQGDLLVAEQGDEVLSFDRGHGPPDITLFVLVVIMLVFGGFGVISVFSDASSGITSRPGCSAASSSPSESSLQSRYTSAPRESGAEGDDR